MRNCAMSLATCLAISGSFLGPKITSASNRMKRMSGIGYGWGFTRTYARGARRGPVRLRLLFFLFLRRTRVFSVHRFLKAPDSFSQPLAEFGQLLGSEDQQGDEQDHQQVHGLEQIIKHNYSSYKHSLIGEVLLPDGLTSLRRVMHR